MNGDDSHSAFLAKGRKDFLLAQLEILKGTKYRNVAHNIAIDLLLSHIGDKEVTEAFNKIHKY